MEQEVKREATKLDRKQVGRLLKRGPDGFKQDLMEFTKHLQTIAESIDSLIKEYPLLIMAEANLRLEFNLGSDPVCKCLFGFTPHDKCNKDEAQQPKRQ